MKSSPGLPPRSAFYEPNLRSVVPQGVDTVMGHFFGGLRLTGPARPWRRAAAQDAQDAALSAAMQAESLAL